MHLMPPSKTACRLAFLFALASRSALALAAAPAPESYEKLWRNDSITQRIDSNIEKYRKGDATIEIVDAAGKPVPGVLLEVRQTSHDFLFGCNAFVLGQLKTPEENARYQEAFLRLFNFATVPLYWEGTEPVQGELRYQEGSRDIWRRPPPDRFIPWAEKHRVTLKGHPLLWHAYNPPWLPKDPDQLRSLYRKRFREIAERYGEHFSIFDVVNESLVCPQTFPLYSPDRAYVAWAFAEVSPLFPPSCTLMINEVTKFNFLPAGKNPYLDQIKKLQAQGASVEGVGLQYHFFRRAALDSHLAGPSCDPAQMLDLYEKLAEFRLPLYITEITIPSAGPDGESLQAQVVADHYRLWFSAPSMAGITWWNLGDGTAVRGENEAQGGLVDNQLQPKAAYRALDQLINKKWKTKAELQTDSNGQARFRGFFGKYQIKAKAGDKTLDAEFHNSPSGTKMHRLTW